MKAPALLAAVGVEANDEAAPRAADAQAHSDDEGALHDDRCAVEREAAGAACNDLLIPQYMAGANIERDHVTVRGRRKQLVAIDSERLPMRRREPSGGGRAHVLPQQIAGARIESLYRRPAIHEHHSVVDERCDFIRALGEHPTPRRAQAPHV